MFALNPTHMQIKREIGGEKRKTEPVKLQAKLKMRIRRKEVRRGREKKKFLLSVTTHFLLRFDLYTRVHLHVYA